MKTRIVLTVAVVLVMAGAQRAQEPPREALDGTDPVLLVSIDPQRHQRIDARGPSCG
jgi:hypothetical protein